jgi:hypothetical protein
MKNKRLILSTVVLLGLIWFFAGERNEEVTLSSPSIVKNHFPRITRVEIFPSEPDLQTVLTVHLESADLDHDGVTYRYQWFVNKKEVSDQPVLPLSGFRRGDLVSVRVIPSDGKGDGDFAQSPVVKIWNNPPVLALVKLLPEQLKAGQAVRAEVQGFDKEEDPIHYDYEWYINDQPVDGSTGADLDGKLIRSNDRVAVKVIPSDPFSLGAPKLSNTFIVANQPPEISSLPPTEAEEGKYVYQVIAKDPDGDVLSYRLEEAPPEMTLNPTSGLLEWNLKVPPAENVKVKIQVDDAKGGKSSQQFLIRKG